MSLKSWMRGLVAGGVAGFVGGLLLAPKKGEEAREDVSRWIDKGKEASKDYSNKWQELKQYLSRFKVKAGHSSSEEPDEDIL